MDQLVELFYAKFSVDVARFQAKIGSSMSSLNRDVSKEESAVGTSAPLREILEVL